MAIHLLWSALTQMRVRPQPIASDKGFCLPAHLGDIGQERIFPHVAGISAMEALYRALALETTHGREDRFGSGHQGQPHHPSQFAGMGMTPANWRVKMSWRFQPLPIERCLGV